MDRPIIFSAPMVRALLDGRKTQTRRAFSHGWSVLGLRWGKNAPWAGLDLDRATADGGRLQVPWLHPKDAARGMEWDGAIYRIYPPFDVGDRLWVREACGRRKASFLGIEATNGVESAFYVADGADVLGPQEINMCPWWKGKASSPMLMPRWASRLTLIVTDVRVQRLQDISSADAIAEGIATIGNSVTIDSDTLDPRDGFRELWNSIHGAEAWAANPWVAAITFTVHPHNIDKA